MPPRLSTAVVKTIFKDGTILPFLYPAGSRRLLSSTTALQQQDGPRQVNQNILEMLTSLPQKSNTAPLPPLSDESSSTPRVPFSGINMTKKKAFSDMHELNVGTGDLMKTLNNLVERRKGIQGSLERVNPEIYRHSPPLQDRSYLNPKDLSFEEFMKYSKSKKEHTREDVFKTLQENPMVHYKNFNLLKDFMTSAGRIKHRTITGLSNTNQRKLSKAIRRAIGIGLMPSVHRHPSIMMSEQKFAMEGYRSGAFMDRPRNEPVRSRMGGGI
ncbi:hypothetical protein ABW20_dc0106436 [Dactylellina cionopaga]|nr:hypothetical protein ABW20_dc0106436 [Dactylellina cionopaga]